jgi:hypothetical protein
MGNFSQGFTHVGLALNYGPSTPITVVVSHVIFGIILGATLSLPA